jgi:hypothetical protein
LVTFTNYKPQKKEKNIPISVRTTWQITSQQNEMHPKTIIWLLITYHMSSTKLW